MERLENGQTDGQTGDNLRDKQRIMIYRKKGGFNNE